MIELKSNSEGPLTIEALHFETGRAVKIVIRNGLISEISDAKGSSGEGPTCFVAPGLIDNQINGYAGVDFSSPGITPEKLRKAAESIWRDGVTTFLPTIITNSHENLLLNFRNISESIRDEQVEESIPGFHLEGPYISPEEGFFGTHPAEFVRKPDWSEFIGYQKAANGKIIQVTLSPEVEGADVFIEECVRNKIFVAIGHTNADASQIRMAVAKGARLSTHLGNGCANQIHRHQNPLWPQLAEDLLTPTIIADGHHLPEELIRVIYKVKGPDNIILTSDVNHLIGMPPGKYYYLGTEVVYSEDGLVKNPRQNCLAGASLPLLKGVGTMMDFTRCPLHEAVNMASKNVADKYNLTGRGKLTPGSRADMILFTNEDNKLVVRQTWLKGKLVHQLS